MITWFRGFLSKLLLLLIIDLGPDIVLSAPENWFPLSFPIVTQHLDAQPINLTNTARAPSTANVNVTITGTALAQTGDLHALDGAENTGAVYALLRFSIATNSIATQIAPKIERQMGRRGWDGTSIDETIAQP